MNFDKKCFKKILTVGANDIEYFRGLYPSITTTIIKKLQSKNIGIEGGVGVGKSTLTKKLAKYLEMSSIIEPVDEEFLSWLDLFYSNRSRYGYSFQTYTLRKRINANHLLNHNVGVIHDRTIFGDSIFAYLNYRDGMICEKEYQLYVDEFEARKREIVKYDVMMLLDVSKNACIDRILERMKNDKRRNCETKVDTTYFENLVVEHRKIFEEAFSSAFPCVVMDWSNFGSVEDVTRVLYYVIDATENKYPNKINYF